MSTDLPPFPRLDDAVLGDFDDAHRRLADRLAALPSDTARLVVWIQRRRLLEAVAGVGAIEFGRAEPELLIPPRRRMLSAALERRMIGCDSALRHIDSRLSMVRMGGIDHVVARETPMVLHAFAEGFGAAADESNPGSMRLAEATFLDDGAEFVPPPADRCRPLMSDMVDIVRSRPPVHRLELASWAAVVVFAVHPFVDGNGRTARLLHQAIASDGLATRFEPCAIEQWSTDRHRYIDALQASTNPCPHGRVDLVDCDVFTRFAARCALSGAAVMFDRIDYLEMLMEHCRSEYGSAAATVAFIAVERNVTVDDLSELGSGDTHHVYTDDLHGAGVLTRSRTGAYDVDPSVTGIAPLVRRPTTT